jgi:hypothetical protein
LSIKRNYSVTCISNKCHFVFISPRIAFHCNQCTGRILKSLQLVLELHQ